MWNHVSDERVRSLAKQQLRSSRLAASRYSFAFLHLTVGFQKTIKETILTTLLTEISEINHHFCTNSCVSNVTFCCFPKDYNTVKGFRVWLIYFRIFQVVIGYCQRTLLLTFYEGIFKMSRSEMIFRLFLDQSQFHSREGLPNILGSFTRL